MKISHNNAVRVDSARLLLIEIKDNLMMLPCGGIGPDGATQEELDDVARKGRHYSDDAMYHVGQQAWLLAQQAMERLSEVEEEKE